MGRALAGLAELPWRGCGLPVLDLASFGQCHAQRVRELAGVQFVHHRSGRDGQPGVSPWAEAAEVLLELL